MKKFLQILGSILILLTCVIIAALLIVVIRTKMTQNDYSTVFTSEKYKTPITIENVEMIQQDISCGYAVIEMFSFWNGGNLTEEDLYDEYGKTI